MMLVAVDFSLVTELADEDFICGSLFRVQAGALYRVHVSACGSSRSMQLTD
jgi:hypothetical protein